MKLVFMLAVFALCTSTAWSQGYPLCKYLDTDGNIHYANGAPEKEWKKLSCAAAEADPG